MMHNILFIDDDRGILNSLKDFLENEGFFVKAVQNPDEGIALVRQNTIRFSLALVDYHFPGAGITGADVIRKLREYDPRLKILAFSGDKTDAIHNLTLQSGAIFFLRKDTSNMRLLGNIHRMCQEVERETQPAQINSDAQGVELINKVGLTGVSNHQAKVAELVVLFAPQKDCVLIRGENGTGKEVIARAIHDLSPHARGPFVPVNCAAIAETLIERELFGHEKGAFTGATSYKPGKFEAADGGTLFLDEIGDMHYHLQSTLLRVLQEMSITPVGSTTVKQIDVRVIAATNAPLEENIKNGTFREDLFYRLNVLPINLAPLRERPEDIPLLAQVFIDQANHDYNSNKIPTQSLLEELKTYSWPGNVRELKHAITNMVIMSKGRTLDTKIIDDKLKNEVKPIAAIDFEVMQFKAFQDEDRIIREALRRADYVVSKAARLANMSRSTFCDKMKRHEIDPAKLKPSEGA